MSERSPSNKSSGQPEPAVEPYLFLALDGNYPKLPTWRYRLGQVDEILIGRGRQREVLRQSEGGMNRLVLRFPDPWMSTEHARIECRPKGLMMTDPGSKNGSYINGVKQESAILMDGDLLQFGRTFFVYRDALPSQPDEPADVATDMDAPPGLLTVLATLARTFVAFAQAAVSDVPLLITGEKGTGKNVLAHSAHVLSGRTGAFVTVPAPGMDAPRLERRLCGHDPDEAGAIIEARGGTLLIDEVSELPAKAQAVLLRILGERQIAATGGHGTVPVECRFMATSSVDLEEMAARGSFDKELLARLSGFTLVLPPLRQRREDLGVLVASMLAHYAPSGDTLFTAEAAHALFCYPWPRNVRELEGCIATALALCDSGTIDLVHLPPELQRPFHAVRDSGGDTIDTIELTEQDLKKRAEIIAVLRARSGDLITNTESLMKARGQFQSWLARRKKERPDG